MYKFETTKGRICGAAVIVTLAVYAAGCLPSAAADLVQEEVVVTNSAAYDWTGFYAGVHAGAGLWNHNTVEYDSIIYDYGAFGSTSMGGLAGLTAGANMQFGAGVIGVEADLSWTSMSTSTTFDDGDMSNSAEWSWLGTIRGRAGLAVDSALIYATAGAAFVDTSFFYGYEDDFASFDGVQVGLTAGVGAEYAIHENLTVKAEYLYIGLPTVSTSDESGAPIDFSSSAHLVRVGLNFAFQNF